MLKFCFGTFFLVFCLSCSAMKIRWTQTNSFVQWYVNSLTKLLFKCLSCRNSAVIRFSTISYFFFGWNVSSQFHCICYMVILIDGIFVGNKKKWNKTSFSSSFDLALLVTKTRLCCKVLRIFHFFFFGFILPAAMNQCKNEHEKSEIPAHTNRKETYNWVLQ